MGKTRCSPEGRHERDRLEDMGRRRFLCDKRQLQKSDDRSMTAYSVRYAAERQPFPGILNFGQARVGVLSNIEESLIILFGFSAGAYAMFCLSLWKAHSR